MRTILAIEFKNLFRNTAFQIGFVIVFLFGLYSIFYGYRTIAEQKDNIKRIPQLENSYIHEVVARSPEKSSGDVVYYMFFYTYNAPSAWAAFSLGQRDVLNYDIKTKVLAVEGQLYDSELANPLSLEVGNLDLSFVFIYLFALLIIALAFNLTSEEKETGVWSIVKTSGVSVVRFVFYKTFVRWVMVVLLALVLLIISAIAFQTPIDGYFWGVLGATILYISFWFSIMLWINAFGKSSNVNATSAVGVWILLCILIPAFGNVVINASTPTPESMETTLIQRQAYNEKWDMPKSVTMDIFYKDYPAYKKYKVPDSVSFHPGWYYAAQYVGDVAARDASKRLEDKLLERQRKSVSFGTFLPSVGTQQIYNAIACTDLPVHLKYLRSVRDYHREISEYFYPFIFEDVKTKDTPWDQRPTYKLFVAQASMPAGTIIFSFIITLALTFSSIIFIKKL